MVRGMRSEAAGRRLESAVIDEAHLGDIRGALGRLRWRQLWPPGTARGRLMALAAVSGPGLLALIADNDAGGIATYAQAGRAEGTRLLWVLLLLAPVLLINQEMAARLGAVSGVGHARLIVERFGRLWGWFSLGDLLLLNALVLVTDFVGVRLAAEHLGVPPLLAVPGAALLLLAATLRGSFRHWEGVMYVLVAAGVAAIPALVLAHHPTRLAAADLLVPGVQGRPVPAIVLVVAIAGATVAPWQLFLQQAVVVDKRITPRWLGYERIDTAVGALLMLLGAAVVMLLAAAAFGGSGSGGGGPLAAGALIEGIGARLGGVTAGLFAVLLLDGAILGAAAVTLATSYAIGDVTGARHSLHRSPAEAPVFYAVFALLVAGASAVVLLPGIPLGFVTTAVQVLAGLLLPSAAVFLLLLGNDTAVLGPWVNSRWLNGVASTSVAGLLVLSALLVVTTLFPQAPITVLVPTLAGCATAGLGVTLVVTRPRRRRTAWPPVLTLATPRAAVVIPTRRAIRDARRRERRGWRTPRLEELRRPCWSRGRLAGMIALRAYLVVSILLLTARLAAAALGR
jgi:Mn2+/Fe2+ NRAMP family transporter